jgi:trimethylamine--corrinoid protein Co-methyltransferase
MVVCAYTQIGRFLGLPTHGYLGQSDAKLVDCQAGLESSSGMVMAALAGVNVVSGAGMLEFESCQSLEKLVIDDEICGMALRLVQGIQGRGLPLAEDLWGDLASGDHFLTSPTTLRWLRDEMTFPGAVIDRRSRDTWQAGGSTTALDRARQRVRDILATHQPKPLADETRRELVKIMSADAKRHGLDGLPGNKEQGP